MLPPALSSATAGVVVAESHGAFWDGSFVDWLSLGVAIIGLLGAGAVGGSVGAVRRLRVEERRHVLGHVLPALDSRGLTTPPQSSDLWRLAFWSLTPDGDSRQQLVSALHVAGEIVDGIERYGLLPWKERALYARVLKELEADPRTAVWPDLWAVTQTLPGLGSEAVADAHPNLPEMAAEFLESDTWDEVGTAVDVLRAYQRRLVNPRMFSRWQNFAVTWELWRRGPRPFDRRVRDLNWSPSAGSFSPSPDLDGDV